MGAPRSGKQIRTRGGSREGEYVDDAMSAEEAAEGYILTCQAVPDSEDIKVRYE